METSKSVIIDNTVLSNFAVVNQFGILKELFEKCAWTTSQVHDEITKGINLGYAFMEKADQQLIISSPSGWIKVAIPTTITEHKLYKRFVKERIFLLCWTISIIFTLNQAMAADRAVVSVVFSSDLEPYRQSWQGFEEFLDEKEVALWANKYNLEKEKPEVVFSRIKEQRPDLVFTLGTKASKLAKEEIDNIPVVFSIVLDPEGLIDSNVSGVSLGIPAGMKLTEIKRILPDVKKIGLVYSPKTTSLYRETLQSCRELGLQLITRKIDTGKEFPEAIKEISRQIDCFLMIPDSKIYFPKSVEYLLLESLRKGFPVVGLSSFYTKAGAFLSFDCDYKELGRQAGEIALKILNGEEPADIPHLRPRKIKLSLNLLAAERLGIKFSSAIIEEAGEVFGKAE
ncbi:MAG: ABC transporter substrate-binding protein [bacterium]|nr:ABC transporter substrate-binding protein [bacterium]